MVNVVLITKGKQVDLDLNFNLWLSEAVTPKSVELVDAVRFCLYHALRCKFWLKLNRSIFQTPQQSSWGQKTMLFRKYWDALVGQVLTRDVNHGAYLILLCVCWFLVTSFRFLALYSSGVSWSTSPASPSFALVLWIS